MHVLNLTVKRWLLLFLITLGVWQFGSGIWIHVKAELAQYLIARAWHQTLMRHEPVKPWPWADTWPVARLRWQENIDLYVLAGINGAALPFGPGMQVHEGEPNMLIAGHRDTHFAFLARIRRGDRLTLTDMQGRQTAFQVQTQQVIDSRDSKLESYQGNPALILVTCYPFDGLRAGGPLRFVVTARSDEYAASMDRKKTPQKTAS